MKAYERHPLSQLSGAYAPDEFTRLQDSVDDIGILEPIMIYEGMILDGWHRYLAGKALGMSIPECQFTGDLKAAGDFVMAKHLRRNMTDSARVLFVAQVNAYCFAKPGRPKNSATAAEFRTSAQTAAAIGVSTRTMDRAKLVTRKGIPKVLTAVQTGQLKIGVAAAIASLPPEQQHSALVTAVQPRPRKSRRGAKVQPMQVGLGLSGGNVIAEHSQEAFEEQQEMLAILRDALTESETRRAVHFMEGTDDERCEAKLMIENLQSELKVARAELLGVKATRNSLMTENGELRAQCKAQVHTIKKLHRRLDCYDSDSVERCVPVFPAH